MKLVPAEVPPGQWLNPDWTWADCILIGKGLDGTLHVFTLESNGKWAETELCQPVKSKNAFPAWKRVAASGIQK